MSDYSKISNYILKGDIGEGNFGKVKLGIFKQTGEEFAVKILNKKMIKEKMKNTVFKENEIITKFNHVNVVFVFDLIEDKENYYIVMEYCKCGELFDYIVEHQNLDEDEAAFFFYQLINGVEYIHSLGVAHRDLKPENLLLTENKILKIIDFGLSHEFNGEDFLKTKCGSPSYAAPEIIKGLPYDGFKTDIWCCGIILYAMVCGYLPFEGDNNKILFKNIVECNPEIPDFLSEATQDLISSILREEPNDRITIDEIKRHPFYLRGKKLCKIDYPKIQRMLTKKRHNMSNNNFDNSRLKSDIANIEDVQFINQQIKISLDNDIDIDEIDDFNLVNKNVNDKGNNSKEYIEDINKDEDNDILIKSVNEISTSKINNNSKVNNSRIHNHNNSKVNNVSKHDNKVEIIAKKNLEEQKSKEPKNHFRFSKKQSNITAFRDKISALNKNFNKKIKNCQNNLNQIMKTDINEIVNNKLNKNPIINLTKINMKFNYDLDSNSNNINTISSTIHQKNNYNNNNLTTNANDINNLTSDKKSIYLENDNISANSKNKINHKLKIPEKDRKIMMNKFQDNNFFIFKNIQKNMNINHDKKKGDKCITNSNDFSRKIKKNDIKNNIINLNGNYGNNALGTNGNNLKNNINIINNINNTINNYGTLNVLPTNDKKFHNHNPNSIKKTKNMSEKSERIKRSTNNFNVIKDMINNTYKRNNYSYKIPKINQNNNYANLKNKDAHSTKSSHSGSKKNNRNNNRSTSKSYSSKRIKNSSNIIGNIKNKGFRIKVDKLNNISHNNVVANIDYNKYMQYPSINITNNLFVESRKSGINNNFNNINFMPNRDSISVSSKNTKRNKTFYKRNNVNANKSDNKTVKKNDNKTNSVEKNSTNKKGSKNKKEVLNYFNTLSTMFMKTENNIHKNKFKNSNTNSINSRVSKNSKKSDATSKNSKSSKSNKSSKKKYNLIRHAIKCQAGNFIFNKKGGSEGKTNRFIQHNKLFNINTFRNNNIQNINNAMDNCPGMNNNVYNNNTSNKWNELHNNIKVVKQKFNKSKKSINYQINFETFKNMYNLNLNPKKKKKLPHLEKKK